MMNPAPRRVLVIDDNEIDREAIRRLVGRDFVIDEAATAHEGLDLARDLRPDCVLLDYRLPDGSGVDLIETFASWDLPVIMLSGMGSESVAVAALKGGAQDYLSKDELSAEALRIAVRGAIDRVALRRRVREQQDQLRILFDQLPALVWTIDRELVVTSASGRQLESLGLGEMVGKPLDRSTAGLLGEAEMLEHTRTALTGTRSAGVLVRDGRASQVHLEPLRDGSGAVIGAIGLWQDTTERHRLEEQLRQSQKMEALGRLAGGVAHDFNNLLTVIVNCASLAKDLVPADNVAQADLDEVLVAGHRAAELTGQLLAFSRRRAMQPAIVDVATQIEGTLRMLVRLLGEDVVLETHLAPDAGAVRIDPGALDQVVVNLAVNARDAMPGGGRLLIDVARVDIDGGWQDLRGLETPPGAYVRIGVHDTGTGMAPEVRARLFEPFFSTKEPGRGTGLGLATVWGIVTQAGGAIHAYSEPGRGTAMHVYLPLVGEAPTAQPTHAPTVGNGDETVLLVEDDPRIRAVATRVLVEFGYTPVVADSGEEALRIVASEAPIDLLVTDMVMPGMSGDRLLAQARQLRPGLRGLLMSGFSPQVVRSELAVRVLAKPFTPLQLAVAVRRALEDT